MELFRPSDINETSFTVTDLAHELEAKYSQLPADMQLVMEVYEDGKISQDDALAYLNIYDQQHSVRKDSPPNCTTT